MPVKLAGAGFGHGTNARFLTTTKVDKTNYYPETLKQLNYFTAFAELYGNPFKNNAAPGYQLLMKYENSSDYPNPNVLQIEGGLLFNLFQKDKSNFLFILPTVGFSDILEPGIDVSDKFYWNIKIGIPVNLRGK